jgi:hypothetical protein
VSPYLTLPYRSGVCCRRVRSACAVCGDATVRLSVQTRLRIALHCTALQRIYCEYIDSAAHIPLTYCRLSRRSSSSDSPGKLLLPLLGPATHSFKQEPPQCTPTHRQCLPLLVASSSSVSVCVDVWTGCVDVWTCGLRWSWFLVGRTYYLYFFFFFSFFTTRLYFFIPV